MFAIVLGTKAELIKMMPVMLELQRRNMDYYFIHTGQHSISDLIEDFGLKNPDIVLYTPPSLSSRFMVRTHKAIFWSIPLIPKIRAAIRASNPSYVLYHGDTLSTSAAAIASSFLINPHKRWKNVHLEAGLRSYDLFEPFPEEISRRIADRFSDILFAPSKLSVQNLRRERIRGKVIRVGNTIADSILISLNIARKRLKRPKERRYVVVNIHRHENIKCRERMKKIAEIVKSVSLPIYWPIHDNTRQQLQKFGLWQELESIESIHFSPLTPYVEFIWLLKHSTFLITDGGSIQEESLFLRKPCILLRKKTERQEGLNTGINFLTGLDVEYARAIIKKLERGLTFKNFKNPYGEA
ncbi:MAG: UDP-N-acetylglucosamine 2-epimerase (non-hydrolyzing), partial [Candidatus Nanoarchaeia archaeon]|nr:UDP-N-acetylglucosamine 2-epimerase (non-hydrolyzing) [Candidatus Haiyanarchaeum thermophilum]